MRWIVLLCLFVLGTAGLGLQRNGSSIKFGQSRQNNYNPSGTQGRGTGVKIGGSSRNLSLPIGKAVFFTSTTTTSTMAPLPSAPLPPEDPLVPTKLHVALVVPHKSFAVREYIKAVSMAVNSISRATKGPILNSFKKRYELDVRMDMKPLTPSPTDILNSLCKEFLSVNVSAILYLMNYEKYGRSTASAQYFLQLAGYLGIPVIAWNADNSGLERRASQSSLQLQLAPSLEHQTAAMLSILERYKWHRFSVVTSQIAGHDDFIQAIRERITEVQDRFKFTILNAVLVTKNSDLLELVSSESRVMLLYATKEEATHILSAAREYQITGENYVWVVTQSVIGDQITPPHQFPVGMLGVHFDTSSDRLLAEITTAIKVYAHGVEDFVNDPRNKDYSLNTQLSCEGGRGESRWQTGDRFFRYLRNVSVTEPGKPNVEFTADGVLKAAELKIMNLRPGVSKQLIWEEIGVWKSWQKEGLDIKDIVWPGNSHTPPQGVPEKFHLRITFLEEPPYISLAPPDPVTGKCHMNRGVICRVAKEIDLPEVDITTLHSNSSYYQCCSGFCIDLLVKFAEELGFTYELVRVDDGRWGTLESGKWNGLIADLTNRKTDMVMTSLMINSEREAVVDFSVPFMETGIAIVVAKRTGIISPTAFLEPFDTASWMLVGVVAIQAATFTIFLFEWLSPSGFNMKCFQQQTTTNDRSGHRFSLFRTYWLVWAVLFQAAVHVDSPRGFTSKFMTNMWAMFAVVFLAIYTANLAAFMITREEYHEFSGIDDNRLSKPYSHKPSLKFGTIPFSHTDSTLKKYFKEMHMYMKPYNKSTVVGGVESVVNGDLDAFIYDGTVLDYLVAQDEDCRLLTVGKWYAKTGYGLAFPRHSKYLQMFNKRLLDFRENGDLERLRRYWMTGTCKPGKEQHKTSDPLALEQFLSAFLLLMMGILLAAALLFFEHLYFKYVRKHLAKKDRGGCCALVSLSMGKSLTFRGAVFEAQDIIRHHRCRDPICDTHLWKVRHELDLSRMRIRQLEKEMETHGIKPSQRRKRPKDGDTCCWVQCTAPPDSPLQLDLAPHREFDFNLDWSREIPIILATSRGGGVRSAGMGRTTTMPPLKHRGETRSPQNARGFLNLPQGTAWGSKGGGGPPKFSPFQQSMPAAWRRQYFRKSILRSAGSMEITVHAEKRASRDRMSQEGYRGSKEDSDPGEGPSSERSEKISTRTVLKTDDGIEINVESERVESIEEEEETFRDFDTPHLSRSLTTPNPRRYRRIIKSEGEGYDSTESAGSTDHSAIQFALSDRGLQRGSETSEEDFKQTNFRRMTVYDRRNHFRRSILKARQQQGPGSTTSSTRSQGSLEQGPKPTKPRSQGAQHPFVKPIDNGLGASLASPPAATLNFFPRSEGSLDCNSISVDRGHSSFESDPGGRSARHTKKLTLMASPPEKTKSQQLLKTDNSLELGVPSRGHHSFESDPGTRAGRISKGQLKGQLAVPSSKDMQRSEGSLAIGEQRRRRGDRMGPRHAHSGPIPPQFQRVRRDLRKEMAEAKKFAETGLRSKSDETPILVRLCSLKRKNGDVPKTESTGNNGSPSSSEGFIAVGREDGNKEILISLACYDRYVTSSEMLRTRDVARNCIATTEYEGRFCASTPQLYSDSRTPRLDKDRRWQGPALVSALYSSGRTEIAEMETVL